MTECPHCHRKFEKDAEYAQHILDKHQKDEVRVDWANRILGNYTDAENLEGGTMNSKEKVKADEAKKTAKQPAPPKLPSRHSDDADTSTLKKALGNLPTIIAVVAILMALWSLLAARTAGTDVQSLQANLVGMQGTVAAHGDNITALQSAANALQTNYSALQASYAVLNAAHTALSTNYATLQTNYNVLVSNVSTLASQLSAADAQLGILAGIPGAQLSYLSNSVANVTMLSSGNYSVFVALYGLNITNVVVSSNHTLANSWTMNITGTSIDTKYVVRVNPVTLWTAGDVMTLNVTSNTTAFAEVWCTKR